MTKTVRWAVLGALFIIPFLPLVVFNGFFFPFITGKNFAFRILVEIAFVGWILLALVDKKYLPRFSWTLVLYGGLVVWMAIADAFAVNSAKAFWSNFERMDGWITLIHVFLFFVVAGAVLSADNLWRKWWLTFLGGATLVCLYAVLQVFGIFAIHQGGARVDATFGNAEYLAAYLLFAIAISIWQAFEAKEKRWLRYSLIALTLLELLILYYTATRGAILGLVAAAGLGALLWMFEAGKTSRRYGAAALVIIVLLSGGFFLIRNSAFVQHDPTLNRIGSISPSDGATRFTIWSMAYEGFLARPITGWGQEGFNYVFNQYYNPTLYAQEQWFDRAHDIYLDWLVAGGLPALLLFLGVLASMIVSFYRSKTITKTERIMLISALAAYCFQGIFVFDNLFTYVPLAMILAMAHDASSRPIAKLDTWKELSESTFNTLAIPLGLIALVLVLWIVNVPNVRAATDLITAITPTADPTSNIAVFKQTYADGSFGDQEISEQLASYAEQVVSDQTISNADKVAVMTYALQQMQMEVNLIPKDARLRLEFAIALRAAGEYNDALTQIHMAEQLSPTKQTILEEEAIEEWDLGNNAAALAVLTKAYQLDTSDTDTATYEAAADIIDGNITGGKQLLQQVFSTTTVDNNVLVVAYYQAKDFPDLLDVLERQVVDQDNAASAEFQLGEAYADAGDISDARTEIQMAISQHPDVASQGASILAQIPEAASTTVSK